MVTTSSKLLIDESPLQVLPSLAVALNNINEAIILQQIHYLLQNNSNDKYVYVDQQGRKWFRDSVEQWNKRFPWMSKNTVINRLKSLSKKGIIITTTKYNRYHFDRTKSYTIDYDKLNELVDKEQNPKDAKGSKNGNTNNQNLVNTKSSKTKVTKNSTSNPTKSSTSNSTKNGTTIYKTIKNTKNNIKNKYSASSNALSISQLDKEFKQIWKLYPSKRGKKEAFNHYKAWRKANPTKHTVKYIVKKLKEYLFYIQQNNIKPRYIMNGSTWFNGRFDDEIDDTNATSNSAGRTDSSLDQYDLNKGAKATREKLLNSNYDDDLPF